MKTAGFLVLSAILLGSSIGFAQASRSVSLRIFEPILGNWFGSLTYLDYSSNKPYSMPADVTVSTLEAAGALLLKHSYPDEQKANSTDTVAISKDGSVLDGAKVASVRPLEGGDVEIVTESAGKDGNDHQPATIRLTYAIGKKLFTIRKEVRFQGSAEWILRHTYAYSREAKAK